MMAAYELLIAAIGGAACWILWFYFVREYRVDRFRNDLFRLRDELFNLALDGEVTFDSRAYVELRNLINGMLRFAHRVNFHTAFFGSCLIDDLPSESSAYSNWKKSLAELPQGVAGKLNRIHERMILAVVRHLLFGSVTLMLVSIYVFGRLAVRFIRRSLNGSFQWSPQFRRRVWDSIISGVARKVPASVIEEEAYREEIKAPELTLA